MTMPAVARRLGVSHSTLYRYVHDRDDLVLAALDLAVREFEWPGADLGWRDLLVAFADALWRFTESHPGMAEAIQSTPGLPARVTELATAYVARLRADGFGVRDAGVALDFVADLTVATEIAMRGLGRVYDTPHGKRSLRELYLESWGTLFEADESVLHGRGWLDDKLAILLDGLANRVGTPTGLAEAIAALPTTSDPRTELVAVALTAHEVLRATRPPVAGPVHDRVVTAFRATGMSGEELAFAANLLWDHVFGAARASEVDRARKGVEFVVDGLLRGPT
jgi:AcrR family transcriptional regulator